MKLRHHLHLQLRNLLSLVPLILIGGVIHAQVSNDSGAASEIPKDSSLIEVFLNQTQLLTVDRPIDSATAEPDNIIKIEKVDGALNEVSVSGLATGHCNLKVETDGRTLNYSVTVTPKPERIYINIPESKRITFPFTVDSTSLSQRDVIRVVQPDTDDKVLLIEAVHPGRTTLTVYVKDQIYRYFITTLENRGADVLDIMNQFTAKGYRNLSVQFDNDEAVLSGSVPTQEELDDAVRIIKQFTPYVVVHAVLGEPTDEAYSVDTEAEQVIVNNIKKISNVPNIFVRVKYPSPTIIETTSYTQEVGDYITPATATTPQGGVIRGQGFLPPPQETGNDDLEQKPRKNTQLVTVEGRDKSVPEKIFIYGDVEDDLQEAKVLRVARTFCPFIVDFMQVKDPIQLRVEMKFLQANDVKDRNTGVNWGSSGPSLSLGISTSAFAELPEVTANIVKFIESSYESTSNATLGASATATLTLFDSEGLSRFLRQSSVFLDDGQPGWYSEGEVLYYISSEITTIGTVGVPSTTVFTASPLFFGLNMDIAPVNTFLGGGTDPTGQKILGVASSTTEGNAAYTVEESNRPSSPPISAFNSSIPTGGRNPFLDQSIKYVDENGVIGLNISTQLTIPGPSNFATATGTLIQLPDFFVRTTRTRAYLRDGQSLTLTGLVDRESTRAIQGVPFFEKLPIFSAFFRSYSDTATDREVFIIVTPHIVRMRDGDSSRILKPFYPETQDMLSEQGMIPQIKPVVFDKAMDIRPEKDMKDVKDVAVPVKQSAAPSAPASAPNATQEAPVPDKNDQTSNATLPNEVSTIDNGGSPGQNVAVGQSKAKSHSSASETLP